MRRVPFILLGIVLVLLSNGCLLSPMPTRATQGHRYSKEALAFLDLPGTSKEEVFATLGLPWLESKGLRILLYEWSEADQYLAIVPHILHGDLEGKVEQVGGSPRRIGLFIAYDEQGIVRKHEVLDIGTSKPE